MILCTRCSRHPRHLVSTPFGIYCPLCWAWLKDLQGLGHAVCQRRDVYGVQPPQMDGECNE